MTFLHNLTIQARIAALGGVFALALAAIAATFFIGENATNSAIERQNNFADIERIAMEIEIGALQMRRREKDFLLRNDPDYLQRYIAEADRVSALIDDLGQLDAPAEVITAAASLSERLPQHRTTFEQVVNERITLGLSPSEGLEGSLRAAVHAVETRLAELEDSELTVLMLMMRRHEKDFMLRVEQRYVDRLDTRQVEFAEMLAQRGYDSATQSELLSLMATYRTDFHAWAETRLAHVDSVAQLSAIFAEMNPDFSTIIEAGHTGAAAASEQLRSDQGRIRLIMMAIISAVAVIATGLIWLVGRSISEPVKALTKAMAEIAEGKTETDIPATEQGGEIGSMANTVLVFRNNISEMERLRAEQAESDSIAAAQKRETMQALADEFDARVGEIAREVSDAASGMAETANTLTAAARAAGQRSSDVANAAEETSANTQAVASAAEELTSSIREIHRQVNESMELTAGAVEEAEVTKTTVSGLAEAVTKIGAVVTLIQSIAEQTNLLALNATIEASRAGEAGKGFAVVASEVKALADQTGKATLEIADQIDAIQKSGEHAITAINSMTGTIDRVSSGSTAIAGAVEQQDSAVSEIAGSVAQAAAGTAQVTDSIAALSTNVSETDQSAIAALSAAETLSHDADRLKSALAEFMDQIRAA